MASSKATGKIPSSEFAQRLDSIPKLSIGNEEYIRLGDFAELVGLARRTCSDLVKYGNRFGKLASIRLLGKTWVPVREVFEFVFTEPGRYGRSYNLSNPGGEKQWRIEG